MQIDESHCKSVIRTNEIFDHLLSQQYTFALSDREQGSFRLMGFFAQMCQCTNFVTPSSARKRALGILMADKHQSFSITYFDTGLITKARLNFEKK
jgi:hypothetical protein